MDPNPSTPDQNILARNLGALLGVDPELAERVGWPVSGEHVVRGSDGCWRYQIHRTWHSLEPEPSVAKKLLEASFSGSAPRRVLLLGCGTGGFLEQLLCIEGLREIRVWERDPWILRIALSRLDVSEELASRRLRLLLTTDLIGIRTAGVAVVEHPFLGKLYARERAHLDDPARLGTVALAAGGLFVDQLGAELSSRGYAPWTLDLSRLSQQEVRRSLRALAPSFLMAVNYTHGLAELAHATGLEVIVWEVDPASAPPRSEGTSTEKLRLFTHARDNLELWRKAGFLHVDYLPLAADPQARRGTPLDQKEHRYGVSFVGQSLVDNARVLAGRFLSTYAAWSASASTGIASAESLLETLVSGQRGHFNRFVVPELLAEHAPGFREAALGTLGLEDPAILAGELAAAEKRLLALASLGGLSPDIWGDEGWRRLESSGACYHGPAGHGAELTSIYDQSTVNLDVGRLYQAGIVTMRVFDVLATGSLVLTEENEALSELFSIGSELATYRTPSELLAKARYFSEHPKQAVELAARGMEAVQARHTIAQRVDTMLSVSQQSSEQDPPSARC